MRFLLRIAFIFILFSTVMSIVRSLFGAAQARTSMREAEQEPERPSISSHLVKDPVCGTYIPEETAIRAKNTFFCSEECRRKYRTS